MGFFNHFDILKELLCVSTEYVIFREILDAGWTARFGHILHILSGIVRIL